MVCDVKALRRFTVRAALPTELQPLADLVMNLRWSWHPESLDLFAAVDPQVWETCGNDPVRLLGQVSSERMSTLARDRRFLRRLQDAADDLADYESSPRWYQSLADAPAAIAYFSPEFGIAQSLPQYSGGLGILAGDHLKSASDLGVPIVGVGLLYRRGYFKQSLSPEGWQLERYPPIDPNGLPLTLLRDADGNAVTIWVGLPGGRRLSAQIWRVQVGRVPLLLLDSDVEDNAPGEREVTDRLYGGGSDHRLLQEMLLGIGGVRALRVYAKLTGVPTPEVYHTNEGHAGFQGVERIRELVEGGLSYDEALEAARAGTVFTTHTPVPAGIDRFPRDLISRYFGGDNACGGVPVERVLALGAEDYADGDPSMFNMAVMGLRLAGRANGVSKLHGDVSRDMFSGLWPGFDTSEVPISSITNGVHAPTWVARELMEIAARDIGADLVQEARGWNEIRKVSDDDLWATRRILRGRLVGEVRRRLRESWMVRGAPEAELAWIDKAFDPDVLTIGFARRVPSYKRLTLMLRDPVRLRALLLDPERPVQMVIAGKAHPADDGGKALVQQIVRFADDPEVRHRIAFLPDYDMGMSAYLTSGTDVWLNNPLRPLEACGTSGMKAALNGGLNLSVRDGWWDEMYDGENGWSIPTADGVASADRRDELEARALYDLIENNVAARFYDRDRADLPRRWIEMVRHTLISLGPQVLASRMVRDYAVELYVPAARAAHLMTDESYAGARQLAGWRSHVVPGWRGVAVEHVESSGIGDTPALGTTLSVRAVVSLGELSPEDVDVQVAYGLVNEIDSLVTPTVASLAIGEKLDGGRYRYDGDVPLARTGPFGYTVRVVPRHELLSGPAALGLVAIA
jgi:glycogen phosphorylase